MPRSLKAFLLLFFFVSLVAAPAWSQPSSVVPEPDPADVESVDAIMAAVYDVISGAAGEKRDWDRMRSLFHPDARLMPSGCNPANGQCGMLVWSIEEYISTAGSQLEAGGFFESEIQRKEERFGQIAHIFSTYESRQKAEDVDPIARGINSFQLYNDGTRWWVVSILWQNESPAAPIPSEYGG